MPDDQVPASEDPSAPKKRRVPVPRKKSVSEDGSTGSRVPARRAAGGSSETGSEDTQVAATPDAGVEQPAAAHTSEAHTSEAQKSEAQKSEAQVAAEQQAAAQRAAPPRTSKAPVRTATSAPRYVSTAARRIGTARGCPARAPTRSSSACPGKPRCAGAAKAPRTAATLPTARPMTLWETSA